MSIYGSRRDRVLDNDPAWERIMLAGTAAQSDLSPTQPDQNGARLRKANPAGADTPARAYPARHLSSTVFAD